MKYSHVYSYWLYIISPKNSLANNLVFNFLISKNISMQHFFLQNLLKTALLTDFRGTLITFTLKDTQLTSKLNCECNYHSFN